MTPRGHHPTRGCSRRGEIESQPGERERGERRGEEREKKERQHRERERSSTARASGLRDFSAELRFKVSDGRLRGGGFIFIEEGKETLGF